MMQMLLVVWHQDFVFKIKSITATTSMLAFLKKKHASPPMGWGTPNLYIYPPPQVSLIILPTMHMWYS